MRYALLVTDLDGSHWLFGPYVSRNTVEIRQARYLPGEARQTEILEMLPDSEFGKPVGNRTNH